MSVADGQLGYSSNLNDGRDDDFHLKSQYGSFHGVALAPVATNAFGTGSRVSNPSGEPCVDAVTSALIDRGAAADAFDAEPIPNGGYINIGAYGGTSQASISPTNYLTLLSPNGGELWPQSQTFNIRWRTQVAGGGTTTFTIDLLNGQAQVLQITNNAADTGQYSWTVPANIPVGDNYRIRITRNDNNAILDTSDVSFSIHAPISVYYVNDNTLQAGDFTTAVGNNANTGLTPADPKASISAVLAAYAMKPGDTILVGRWNLYTVHRARPQRSGQRHHDSRLLRCQLPIANYDPRSHVY